MQLLNVPHQPFSPIEHLWLRLALLVLATAVINRATCVAWPQPNQTASNAQAQEATYRPVSHLKLQDVQWEEKSFWGERQVACQHGSLPTISRYMLGTERSQFVENFRIAAGSSNGKHRGPGWNDGDTYKWLEALAATYARTHDAELLLVMNSAIEVIAKAQRSDGYLHTPVLIAARAGSSDAKPFGDPVNFEMYNFGHLMTAACVHFEVTQDRRLLDVAIKAADFLDREFSRPDPELARHAICPAHYMGILELFRVTKNPRYLTLARRFLEMRDLVQGGDDNQDRVPLHLQRVAVGHAVRANYLYAGAADLALETGDHRLQAALESCWSSVEQKKLYITGGCGALFDGASPDGSKDQSQITRVHQAYGRNYQLPNSTAHNETCAAIGFVLWNQRMWQLTDEVKYVDSLENSLMNAVLAGVSLDGERFFYTNTLRQLNEMPTELRWARERKDWISCYCCPPNVARIIAAVNRYAYAVDLQQATVLLYGSNQLTTTLADGLPLKIEQHSNYPLDGRVTLNIQSAPSRPYTLRFRIPGWCTKAVLKLNGVPQVLEIKPATFATVTRTWAVGDRVELELDMPTELVCAHPLVEECRGQVAVRRGPLVYCAESVDLPDETSITAVTISPDETWDLKAGFDRWEFIPILHGKLWLSPSASASTSNTALYTTYKPALQKPSQCKLIPYFAWSNRGPSEMSVWLPLNTTTPSKVKQ